MNPELKTVPVEPTDEMLRRGTSALTYGGTPPPDHDPGDSDYFEDAKALWAAMLAASPQPVAGDEGATLQSRVHPWMMACFGPEISADEVERGDRLLEEVFEALQSRGYDPGRVASLRDYVWSRPVGETVQEVGGVMITLAAFCLACGVDMHEAGETELARIWTKVEKIRAKQAAKPRHSPLPVAHPPPPADLKARPVAWRAKYGRFAWRAKYGRFAAWVYAHGSEGPNAEDRAACLKMWPDFVTEPLYTEASLSAAHAAGKDAALKEAAAIARKELQGAKATAFAAGKAEGEAEWRAKAEDLGQALAALEAQCQPVASIEKLLADNIEFSNDRWYVLPDGLKAGIYAIRATAKVEALEEAARLIEQNAISYGDVQGLAPRRHGDLNGTFYANAIRALISAPLPPREEPCAKSCNLCQPGYCDASCGPWPDEAPASGRAALENGG